MNLNKNSPIRYSNFVLFIILFFFCNNLLGEENFNKNNKIKLGDFAPTIHAKTLSESNFFLGNKTGATASEDNKAHMIFLFFKTSSEHSLDLIQNLVKENKNNASIEIFLVNVGENKTKIRRTIAKYNIERPVLLDPNKFISKKRYNITELPAILCISKDRKILCLEQTISNDHNWEALLNKVSKGQMINSFPESNRIDGPEINIKGKIGYE